MKPITPNQKTQIQQNLNTAIAALKECQIAIQSGEIIYASEQLNQSIDIANHVDDQFSYLLSEPTSRHTQLKCVRSTRSDEQFEALPPVDETKPFQSRVGSPRSLRSV